MIDAMMEAKIKRTYPGGLHSSNEELTSVGVRSGICHTEVKGALMLDLKVLIGKLFSIDAFATSPVSVGEVSSL